MVLIVMNLFRQDNRADGEKDENGIGFQPPSASETCQTLHRL